MATLYSLVIRGICVVDSNEYETSQNTKGQKDMLVMSVQAFLIKPKLCKESCPELFQLEIILELSFLKTHNLSTENQLNLREN